MNVLAIFTGGLLCFAVGMIGVMGADLRDCQPPVIARPATLHNVQYSKDWSFGDPHEFGRPPKAWQQPQGVTCLIVLDLAQIMADMPNGVHSQVFVGNFPNPGDKLTMRCETVAR